MDKNILLTGYWFPTNEILREFAGGITNWNQSGFNIYSYFPEIEADDRGEGSGRFKIDFASTYNDFTELTAELKPVAIVSFGYAPFENFRFEVIYPARFQSFFESGDLPSKVGARAQTKIPDSLKTSQTFHSSLPVTEIKRRLDEAKLENFSSHINSQGDPGEFLCAFLSYLLGWYHSENKATNLMAGFIHAQGHPEILKTALRISLEEVVRFCSRRF